MGPLAPAENTRAYDIVILGAGYGGLMAALILQLPFPQVSESMGNHDSKIVDAASVD
jgi:flavin-dependent dehydrogenase